MKRTPLAIGVVVATLLFSSCATASPPATPTPLPAAASPSPTSTAISAVGSTPTTAPKDTPAASPTLARPASPTAQPAAGPKAEVAPAAILAKAASARGLVAKGEVPFATLSREELRPYLVKVFEKEHGREDLEKARALWLMLDLLGEKDDLYGLWLGLLDEQVAGFYEPDSRSMKLIGGGGPISAKDELVLAHEYVHALQDQHFGLGDRVKQVKHDGEKGFALQTLMEGDATLAMLEYANMNMSRDVLASLQKDTTSLDARKLQAAPLVLQVSLLFPYQQGVAFVGSLFGPGGWAAVNKAYANPPATTEQIIHPEKYTAGEGPVRIDLPDVAPALGQGWSPLDKDTIGELGWLVYFANGLDPKQAGIAAIGWGGDQYVLFRSSTGKTALAALSAWDTEDDAEDFFGALYDLQDVRESTKYTLDEDTRFGWTRGATSGYASIKGRQVLLVITPDEATTKRVVGRFGGF